jgi:hypothetical protein
MIRCAIASLYALSTIAVFAEAQTSRDTISAREVAPGVSYRRFPYKNGPLMVHLVRVDLRHKDIDVRVARAKDQLRGRERTTEMVARPQPDGATVLAAVNGDFFELASGENENNQIVAGEWWKGLKVTDSPYDTFDNVHVQFGFDARRKPLMDRFTLDARAIHRGAVTPITTVNSKPTGTFEGSALYTSRFGDTTPRDTTRQFAEAPLEAAGRRGDTLVFVRRGPVSPNSATPIPRGGAVLSAFGNGLRTTEVRAMAEGDTVEIVLATLPRPTRGAAPAILIGGWPRILRDGRNVAPEAPTVEGTISRNAEMVHPRTAIGFSRDSTTLYLLTLDGHGESSGGATLSELADLMRRVGAWNAMNFDGGGSTTMVIDGQLMNTPTDAAGERAVGNALLIVRRR